MKNLMNRLVKEEAGQDIIEYALLGAGISIAAILVIEPIGTAVTAIYTRINGALAAV